MSEIYHGWDVHSYTPDLRAALAAWRSERPRLSELLDLPVKREVIDGPISEFFLSRNAELKAVLDKMRDRSEQRNSGNLLFYGDRDLDNLNIWALLAIAVNLALAEKGPPELLVEMLVDTAQTCTQGDSHRIAMFVLGSA
jgi:hypothetical protein